MAAVAPLTTLASAAPLFCPACAAWAAAASAVAFAASRSALVFEAVLCNLALVVTNLDNADDTPNLAVLRISFFDLVLYFLFNWPKAASCVMTL